VIEPYAAGEVDAVYAVYNEFKTVLTQKLTLRKLLPIELAPLEAAAAEQAPQQASGHAAASPGAPPPPTEAHPVDYIYEQPAAEIFGRLLPRYVETQVFAAMLESSASEHAARMTAMDSATNNAAELIEHLTLHMNKVRQAAITKEILEVVSGAAWSA